MSRRTGSSDVGKNRVGQIDTMTRPNRWTKVRRTEPPTGRPRQSYFGIFNTLLFSILNISYKGFYKLRGTMAHFVPLSVSPCPRIMCTQLLKIDFLLFAHAFSATTIWLYTSGRLFPSQAVWIETLLRCPKLFGLPVMYSYHKRSGRKKTLVVLDCYHKRYE